LVADTWESLYSNNFTITNYNFPVEEELYKGNIETRVRGFGLNPQGETQFEKLDEKHYRVILENPAWAIAPGQPAVFYQDEKLVGGGVVV
jgi:tRNA-specific 2-thiouridylase